MKIKGKVIKQYQSNNKYRLAIIDSESNKLTYIYSDKKYPEDDLKKEVEVEYTVSEMGYCFLKEIKQTQQQPEQVQRNKTSTASSTGQLSDVTICMVDPNDHTCKTPYYSQFILSDNKLIIQAMLRDVKYDSKNSNLSNQNKKVDINKFTEVDFGYYGDKDWSGKAQIYYSKKKNILFMIDSELPF